MQPHVQHMWRQVKFVPTLVSRTSTNVFFLERFQSQTLEKQHQTMGDHEEGQTQI